MKNLIDKLYKDNYLNIDETAYILENIDKPTRAYLAHRAHETRMKVYGNKVYMRGLIEFTNYCKVGCRYCGINRTNKNVDRYRLGLEDILESCQLGYKLGYRTFVLQGGEDDYFTDEILVEIIKEIKNRYEDVAITLSVGEKAYESYEKYYKAGADRYLLRHETANANLFKNIHNNLKLEDRVKGLYNLKKIGYQVGAGFMVGIPGQVKEDLAKDLLFLKELDPEMVGIGPFIPHIDTIYRDKVAGTLDDTITMIAMTRLFLPQALLPSTTALSSIDPKGREIGLKAGANVVMPNLSPKSVREKYSLYNGKVSSGEEAAECKKVIEKSIKLAGFSVDMSRGDSIKWRNKYDRS